MRLATRTGLAAFAAATLSMLAIGAVFNRLLPQVLQERVDDQLIERADSAPIVAAVADRLARSELTATVEGARVLADGELIEVGLLPVDPLPPIGELGFETASADGQRWRLLTIEVVDVPRVGDRALVQLAAPLGDVDARTRELRRRLLAIGLLAAGLAGVVGYLLGRRATRPLSELRGDAVRIDDADPSTWTLATTYHSPDVDDLAGALNSSLSRLADESTNRRLALESARSFAASATHELRTPLQSALTNIDIAMSSLADEGGKAEALEQAHHQLQRMASGLSAVRALADAEFAAMAWFVPADLAEVVEAVITEETRRVEADVTVTISPGPAVPLWRDGARLAVGNVLRNALVHGRDRQGKARIAVDVSGSTVTIDDSGTGIRPSERERVVQRFERGVSSGGSGLGLAIAQQVTVAHGGRLDISDSATGGTRVVLRFGR